MDFNPELVKKILSKLEEKYPKSVERTEHILPNYKDPEEICSYLLDLKKQGYVELIDASSRDGKGCLNIKITPHGIEYYKNLLG
jgi:hypothetical protein